MLPRTVPAVPGVTTAVRYLPAGSGLQIGGDWYDVVPLPGGHVGLVIGDVQGHDVHAAGIMGQLRIALRAYAAEGHPPAAVMARASRFWPTSTPTSSRPAPIPSSNRRRRRPRRPGRAPAAGGAAADGHAVQTVAGGAAAGGRAGSEYPVTELQPDPGETVVLCTDGLVESRTMDLDTGMARLCDAVSGELAPRRPGSPEPLEDLADTIASLAADSSEREDDIALLLLRWDGTGGRAGRPAAAPPDRPGRPGPGLRAARRAAGRAAPLGCGGADRHRRAARLRAGHQRDPAHRPGRDVHRAALPRGRSRAPAADRGGGRVGPLAAAPHPGRAGLLGPRADAGRGAWPTPGASEPRGSGKRMWFELTAGPSAGRG